jgi:uncharacterized protein (TIGR02001 family)
MQTMSNKGVAPQRFGVGALALAALAAAGGAQADSDDGIDFGTFGGSASLSSDYVFRGISNTDEQPQVQVDLNWSHSSGFYTGVWGSNTDFGGAGNSMELDPYIGFASSVGDTGLSYDVGYWYYTYPGSSLDPDPDYGEAYAIGTYSQGPFYVSPSVWYADEYFGADYDGLAYDVTVGWEFPWGIEASARIGEQTFSSAADNLDYTYYDIGASKSVAGFDLGLRWHDTDDGAALAGDPDLADSRVVFSVSRSF